MTLSQRAALAIRSIRPDNQGSPLTRFERRAGLELPGRHAADARDGPVRGLPAQRPQRLAFCSNRAENSAMRERFLPKSNSPKVERER